MSTDVATAPVAKSRKEREADILRNLRMLKLRRAIRTFHKDVHTTTPWRIVGIKTGREVAMTTREVEAFIIGVITGLPEKRR